MLGWILLAIGIAGFGAAGYLDLKTTEFPDWLPYSIIIAALAVRAAFAFILSDISIVFDSIIVGCIFLGIGLGMYFTKQWGDGDAWLLGALGFLFPGPTGFVSPAAGLLALPFPVVMIFNFFFVSFFYLIAYSVALGLLNPGVPGKFRRYIGKKSRHIAAYFFAFSAMCAAAAAYLHIYTGIAIQALGYIALFPLVFLGLILFLQYGRFIEGDIFKRRIKAKDLKPGDVPVGSKWMVLSKADVRKLKRKGGHIWIKEGIRFAPVFILTILLTLAFGNLLLIFAGL